MPNSEGVVVDNLSSRVAMLQRLSPAEFDVLRLRCEGRTTTDISAMRGIPQREVLFRLAHAYDILWLTHLDRDARQDRIDDLCAAAAYIHANELPPSPPVTGETSSVASLPPPQAAVMAVVADEQRLIARRGTAAVAPSVIIAITPGREPLDHPGPIETAVPAERDASLARLTIFSIAIVTVLILAIAAVFGGDDVIPPAGLGGGAPATAEPLPTRRPLQTPSAVTDGGAIDPTTTATIDSVTTAIATTTIAGAETPGVEDTRPPAPTLEPEVIETEAPTEPAIETPTPEPAAPVLLYQADWSGGLGDWVGTGDWTTEGGNLVNSGGQGYAAIYSPFQPIAGTSYVVEAEMQIDTPTSSGAITGIAVSDPANPQSNALRVATYWIPDTEWHSYRLEVNGDTVTLLIDGQFAGRIIDPAYTNPGRVGIYTNAARLQVRRFEVIG